MINNVTKVKVKYIYLFENLPYLYEVLILTLLMLTKDLIFEVDHFAGGIWD